MDIGWSAFEGCENLENHIFKKLKAISGYMFNGCHNLTYIIIPDSVTKIEERAFKGCKYLRYAVIPDNVTRIGSEAFSECSMLYRIVLPDELTEIGAYIFFMLFSYNKCYYV